MNQNLLLNQISYTQFSNIVNNKDQTIIISGNGETDRELVANELVQSITGVTIDKLTYLLKVEPIEGSIKIDMIREIRKFLRLKTTGTHQIRRAIIISEANLMTLQAQNALLKTIEEPPQDTMIVLTTSSEHELLETIRSRASFINLSHVPRNDIISHLEHAGYSENEIKNALQMSGGSISLATSILEDETDHDHILTIKSAKNLLASPLHKKLILIDTISKDKITTKSILEALGIIAFEAMKNSISKNTLTSASSWTIRLDEILKAQSALKYNANRKIVLTNLVLSI